MDSLVKQLREACEDSGEVSFRESYSGRAMYGRDCVGIVGSMEQCLRVIAQVTTNLTQEAFEAATDSDNNWNEACTLNDKAQEMQTNLLRFLYDSMGYNVIVYWPSIKPEPEDE